MILNAKKFWTWWTTELREWFGVRYFGITKLIEKTKEVILNAIADLHGETIARKDDLDLLAKDSTVAKEAAATRNKEDVIRAIGAIPQPTIPTDYAKEETLTSKSSEIITEVRKGGGNPSKTAYEAMKRLQPYLYAIEYSELDYEGARDYFATHFVPVQGACTALRKGNQLGRNYDWKYNNEVEFLVRTKAHNGRYASIGIAGSISALTTATIGEYSDEFKWMPFRMLDGMNEKGLTANVNMLNHDEERSLPQEGTTPLIEEREAICSAMLVRYVLDNFATPQEACEYIRDYVRVYPPYSEGHTTDLHFALTNKEQLYYLCFEPDNNDVFRTMIADVKDQPLPFVMTNFRMWWASRIFDEETGHYDRFANPDYDKVEKYAMGIERANLCLEFVQDETTSQSVLEFMREELAYTRSYFESTNPQWLTEFVGEYSEEDLARDSAATDFDRILSIVRQRYQERSRETALTWQTVHSVVYDLDTLTMQLVTQDGSVEDALTFDPFKALPASKGDLENIDLSDVAKESTLTDGVQEIKDKIDAIPTPQPITGYATEANLNAKSQEIKEKIDDLSIPTVEQIQSGLAKTTELSPLAKESSATANKNEILTAIGNIPQPDLSIVAKQGDNPQATNTAILAAIPSVETMKQLYAARAEQNNDGDNTYTIVLPYTAQVEETPDGYQITL